MIEIGITFLIALTVLGLLTLALGAYGLYRVARMCWASFKLGYAKETLRQLEAAEEDARGTSILLPAYNAWRAKDQWPPLDASYTKPRVTYRDARAPGDDFFDEHVTITDED